MDDNIAFKVPKVMCLFHHLLDLIEHSSASCQCHVCQHPSLSTVFFSALISCHMMTNKATQGVSTEDRSHTIISQTAQNYNMY